MKKVNDEGIISYGPMAILLGIGSGIILLSGAADITIFANSSESSVISSSGPFELQACVKPWSADVMSALITAKLLPSNTNIP